MDLLDILDEKKIRNIEFIKINIILYKFIARINDIPKIIQRKLGIFSEKFTNLEIKNHKKPFLIYGYFQDLRYMLTKNLILEYIDNDFKKSMKLNKTFKSLGIHIRRGDYLKKKHFSSHGLISTKYIIQNFIPLILDSKNIIVYSDSDIKKEFLQSIKEYIRKDFINQKNIIFTYDEKMSDKEVFISMANNDSLICTNSTFSYWSGYLSENNRRVYLPKQWFRYKEINKGLIHNRVELY